MRRESRRGRGVRVRGSRAVAPVRTRSGLRAGTGRRAPGPLLHPNGGSGQRVRGRCLECAATFGAAGHTVIDVGDRSAAAAAGGRQSREVDPPDAHRTRFMVSNDRDRGHSVGTTVGDDSGMAEAAQREDRSAVMARTATWARQARAARQRGLESGQQPVVVAAGAVPEQPVATAADPVPAAPVRLGVGWERPVELPPLGPPPGAADDAPAYDPWRSAGRATKARSPAGASVHARVAGRAALAPPDRRPASRPHGRLLPGAAWPPRRPPPPGSPWRSRAVPTVRLWRDRRSVRE
jgi:hypothetical protein